jgi:hypothetical protein
MPWASGIMKYWNTGFGGMISILKNDSELGRT